MTTNPVVQRFLPFRRWLPYNGSALRADFLAGLTVALVLVPQSMAYAQLAGLPAYYGLYAAFLPVIIGAMWGSSHQLATGPVAMVSLLTGSALAQFAAPGTAQFIALAILLVLMVGIMELAMGLFRLGAIVNFLSHPVIVGLTNAAAMIIGLSQFNKLIGVPMGRSEFFINDIWGVVRQVGDTHGPTLVCIPTREQRCWVHKTANVLNKMPQSLQAKAKQMLHDIWMAATRADSQKAFDLFLASFQSKYPKATECLEKDRDVLLTFYDFPAEHWIHLRTTNPIESTFATVRLRTARTKGCGSRTACLTMVFKLVQSAKRHWRALNGSILLPDVLEGVQFTDGVQKAAACS